MPEADLPILVLFSTGFVWVKKVLKSGRHDLPCPPLVETCDLMTPPPKVDRQPCVLASARG